MSATKSTIDLKDLNALGLHPEHPQRAWVVVEQPKGERTRYSYDPVARTFVGTEFDSLISRRRFTGVYGWIGGSGLPPEPHFDVLMFTDETPTFGSVIAGFICGMFMRGDGDHKFVAVDDAWSRRMLRNDILALPRESLAELLAVYPMVDVRLGEGWFGGDHAHEYLRTRQPQLHR
jgi:inorganic pyrophosphatase